jgi:hypothetical protein
MQFAISYCGFIGTAAHVHSMRELSCPRVSSLPNIGDKLSHMRLGVWARLDTVSPMTCEMQHVAVMRSHGFNLLYAAR